MNPSPESPKQTACRRCGTCCRKGGPSLHLEDRELVVSGLLPLSCLVTIRKGEWVYDGKMQVLRPVDREFVRIRGRGTGWSCLFWDAPTRSCTIYPDRPIECRALACWDTREIEAIYDRPRLTRKQILVDAPGWMELVQTHESSCSIHQVMASLRREKEHSDGLQLQALLDCDEELRRLTVERSGIDPALLPFLFGRPLQAAVAQIRLACKRFS